MVLFTLFLKVDVGGESFTLGLVVVVNAIQLGCGVGQRGFFARYMARVRLSIGKY